MEEVIITMEQFCTEHGIKADFVHTGIKTTMEKNREGVKEPHSMDGWLVTLSMAGKTMSTEFKTGLGLRTPDRNKIAHARGFWPDKREIEQMKNKAMMSKNGAKWLIDCCDPVKPEVQQLIDCLASDASAYDCARNFEDFCADFGYDEDSRKAESIYKGCGDTAKELKFFLGSELYEKLLYKVERL